MKIYELSLPEARAFSALIERGLFGNYWVSVELAAKKLEELIKLQIGAEPENVLWFSSTSWVKSLRNPTVSVKILPSKFEDEPELEVQLSWEEKTETPKVVPPRQINVDGVVYTSQPVVITEYGDWTTRHVTRVVQIQTCDVWGTEP